MKILLVSTAALALLALPVHGFLNDSAIAGERRVIIETETTYDDDFGPREYVVYEDDEPRVYRSERRIYRYRDRPVVIERQAEDDVIEIIDEDGAADSARDHVRWCANRYRSYNPDDNTWVSYGGRVRSCNSPYS